MSLFSSPEEHAAHPPSSWIVRKHGRKWGLFIGGCDHASQTFATKHEAEAAKTTGFHANLYAKEARWYAGESVDGWKPYAVIEAERAARAQRIRERIESTY